MKSLLAFLIAMGSIVTLSDAVCFHKLQNPGRHYRGCRLNGKLYPFGRIERTEDCHACICTERAMSCCSLFFTSAYHDESCKVVFNRKLCKFAVVQKDDPSKTCPKIFSAVL